MSVSALTLVLTLWNGSGTHFLESTLARPLTLFKNFFGRHKSFFIGRLIPLFGTSGDIFSGFKARVVSLIRTWQRHTCSLRFTYGVTLANLSTSEPISSKYLRAGIGGARNQDLSCHRRTLYQLSYAGSA